MAEVVWNANGQGEFDFDYLLNLTDEKFVKQVTTMLDSKRNKAIKVIDLGYLVQVLMVEKYVVQIFIFNKEDKEISFAVLNKDDVDWVGSVFNG